MLLHVRVAQCFISEAEACWFPPPPEQMVSAPPSLGHTDLLEVCSEAVHVLVVGQHGVSLGLEEVDVPDAQKSQQDGHVLLQRGAAEMVVLETRDPSG